MSEYRFLSALSSVLRDNRAREAFNELQLDIRGMNNLLNDDLVARMHDKEEFQVAQDTKFECDVLVVTPIFRELRSATLAFGVDFEAPTTRDKNIPVFEFERSRLWNLPPIKVKLTTLNCQRNVNSGPVTSYLLEKHKPKAAIMSGIAGIKDSRSLGECSAFHSVTYAAGGVETPEGKDPESQVNNISEEMKNLINSYEDRRELFSERDKFRQALFGLMKKIDGEIPDRVELEEFEPLFSVKKLLSGETLRKDGGFTKQAEAMDRLITMVEMEASGFAIACEIAKVDWLVFRSSCDYANPDKNDKWQRLASLNSALSVDVFLEKEYRTTDEMF